MASRTITLVITSIYWIVCLFITGLIFWGLNKGFDLTDEGYHMMNLAKPDETPARFQYQHYFNQVLGFFNLGIWGFKIVRLLLTLIGSAIFSWGLAQWIGSLSKFKQSFKQAFLLIFPFITMASFISYSLQPRTLSYNNLTLIALLIASGLVFFYVKNSRMPGENGVRNNRIALAALGWTWLFLFFCKFTSAISFAIMFIPLVFFMRWNHKNLKAAAGDYLWFGLGLLIGILHYHLTIDSFFTWFADLKEEMGMVQGHNPERLLGAYLRNTINSCARSMRFSYVLWFLPILAVAIERNIHRISSNERLIKAGKMVAALIFLGSFTYLCYRVLGRGQYKNRFLPLFYFWYLLLAGFLVLSNLSLPHIKKLFKTRYVYEILMLLVFLLGVPYVGSAGTNNPLSLQVMQYMFAWFGIVYILSAIIAGFRKEWNLSYVLLTALGIFCTAQVFHGYFYCHQRVKGDITVKTEVFDDLPGANNIYFNKERFDLVEKVRNAVFTKTNYQANDPIIAFHLPGMVYMLDGVTPGDSWYKSTRTTANCYNLRKTSLKNLERLMFIIPDGQFVIPGQVACLKDVGVNYMEDYYLLESIDKGGGKALNIFAPKNLIKPDVFASSDFMSAKDKKQLDLGRNKTLRKIWKMEEDVQRRPSVKKFLNLGLAYKEIAEYDDAINAFNGAINMNETAKRAHCELCNTYIVSDEEDLDVIKEACAKAKQLMPKCKVPAKYLD